MNINLLLNVEYMLIIVIVLMISYCGLLLTRLDWKKLPSLRKLKIIGSATAILSIILTIIQIQFHNIEGNAKNHFELLNQNHHLNKLLLEYSDTLKTFNKKPFPDNEIDRLIDPRNIILDSVFNFYELLYFHKTKYGVLYRNYGSSMMKAMESNMETIFAEPYVNKYWEWGKGWYDDEFIDYIDSIKNRLQKSEDRKSH